MKRLILAAAAAFTFLPPSPRTRRLPVRRQVETRQRRSRHQRRRRPLEVRQALCDGALSASQGNRCKAALATKGPKRIAISLIKDVDGDTFASAVSKGINNNASDAEQAALKDRVKQLVDTVNALGEIKAKSSIVFDWIPEKGTILTINGQMKAQEIPGEDFANALLRVWLGEDPVQNDLKQGLLGKPTEQSIITSNKRPTSGPYSTTPHPEETP